MTLTPLLNAPLPVQIHAFAALAILPLTLAMFTLPRGTARHRVMGWGWVALMAAIALSSFWIREIRMVGGFGPIHLLSLVTLAALARAVTAARRGQVGAHRSTMTWLTCGALVGAGLFTLLPGRIMHVVVLGG